MQTRALHYIRLAFLTESHDFHPYGLKVRSLITEATPLDGRVQIAENLAHKVDENS